MPGPATNGPSGDGKKHLTVYDRASSLGKDGHRNYVHPADVKGRFTTARHVVFAILGIILVFVPWIRIAGRPALFLDVPARRFFLFGASFNAQDFWLAFFLATGLLFTLLFVTTVLGRVWCAWACPQTVFLEGVFRPIERFLEGPRNERLRRNAGPRNFDFWWRKIAKHALFVLAAGLIAHAFLAYFVSIPSLIEMVQSSPSEHATAFAWMVVVTALLYGNFAWFREQLCLIICPYGRLQSILTDDDSLVVGYDARRGEPRGKGKGRDGLGSCVDCDRCVAVCPTGIDIRNGLQLDCIGCTQCIDACDEVMDKLKQPRGLVRYDSLRSFQGGKRRFLRPRVFAYVGAGLLGLTVATFAMRSRTPFESNLLRMRGMPYVVEGDLVRNTFELHVINKQDHPLVLHLTEELPEGIEAPIPDEVRLEALENHPMTIVARGPREAFHAGATLTVVVTTDDEGTPYEHRETAPLLGPR
ncbi:MAG: cytochrome c oxidase accessory protein CcoG [Sandaracinus sp.]